MPTLPITDDASGSSGDPLNGRTTTTGGATWVSDVNWEILTFGGGNSIYPNGSTGIAKLNAGAASVVFSWTQRGSDFLDILFWGTSNDSAYLRITYFGGNYYLRDEANSDVIPGGAAGSAPSAANVYVVSLNGDAIQFAINGSVIFSTTDSGHSSNTYFGFKNTSGGSGLAYAISLTAFVASDPALTVSSITDSAVELTATTQAPTEPARTPSSINAAPLLIAASQTCRMAPASVVLLG
jgi:hypothetical protein